MPTGKNRNQNYTLVQLVALVTVVLLVDQKKDQEQGQRLQEENLFF